MTINVNINFPVEITEEEFKQIALGTRQDASLEQYATALEILKHRTGGLTKGSNSVWVTAEEIENKLAQLELTDENSRHSMGCNFKYVI